MTQYTFWLYIRIQMRLAVILSILARARATQKRKAKTLKIRPKSWKFGPYFEKCAICVPDVCKLKIWFYSLILHQILYINRTLDGHFRDENFGGCPPLLSNVFTAGRGIFGVQKFLRYRRNFWISISGSKFQTWFTFIIFPHMAWICPQGARGGSPPPIEGNASPPFRSASYVYMMQIWKVGMHCPR